MASPQDGRGDAEPGQLRGAEVPDDGGVGEQEERLGDQGEEGGHGEARGSAGRRPGALRPRPPWGQPLCVSATERSVASSRGSGLVSPSRPCAQPRVFVGIGPSCARPVDKPGPHPDGVQMNRSRRHLFPAHRRRTRETAGQTGFSVENNPESTGLSTACAHPAGGVFHMSDRVIHRACGRRAWSGPGCRAYGHGFAGQRGPHRSRSAAPSDKLSVPLPTVSSGTRDKGPGMSIAEQSAKSRQHLAEPWGDASRRLRRRRVRRAPARTGCRPRTSTPSSRVLGSMLISKDAIADVVEKIRGTRLLPAGARDDLRRDHRPLRSRRAGRPGHGRRPS